MKTARERAEFWLAMNVAGYTEDQVKYLEVLLKEQNQITRTTCANAIADENIESDGVPYYKTESILALAQKVCMEVKAV